MNYQLRHVWLMVKDVLSVHALLLQNVPDAVKAKYISVCSVSPGTCLHALMFKKLFFSYCPLSETRAQSALIG